MNRPLLFALLLVTVDQSSKSLALHKLAGVRFEWVPGWGPLPVLLLVAGCLAYYHRFYRRSLWADLAAALFWAATLGNLYLDRWSSGGARDFLLTPWFVANLADCYGIAALVTMRVECTTYPVNRTHIDKPFDRRVEGFFIRHDMIRLTAPSPYR